MSANDLKRELVSYIESTDDELFLSLLKEDIVFYGKVQGSDITDGLSEEQLTELKLLSEDDEMKDTHTLYEFKELTQQWCMK